MNSFRQTAVGIFVLLGLVCVAYLTIKLGKMEVFDSKGFELVANFNSVSGLRVGADVEMAGVPVGRVASRVVLILDKDLQLPADTIASVKTSGLIGDKYVNLTAGGSEDILASGDTLEETESAVDIESLISKYALGGV